MVADKTRSDAFGRKLSGEVGVTTSHTSGSDTGDTNSQRSISDQLSLSQNPFAYGSGAKIRRKLCHVLSFADRDQLSNSGDNPNSSYRSLRKPDLKAILELYPNGGIMTFDGSGMASSTEESESEPILRKGRKQNSGRGCPRSRYWFEECFLLAFVKLRPGQMVRTFPGVDDGSGAWIVPRL